MNKKILISFVLGLMVMQLTVLVNAQKVYSISQEKSEMVVKGTSTIHDWEMKVEKITGDLTFDNELILEKITGGNIIVPVKSMVSDHSLMNKKAYEALKEDDFPQIKGKLIKIIADQTNPKAMVELTIAGAKKTHTYGFQYKIIGNQIQISGSWKLKMTDFSVDPPEALMGTIKTENEITIDFKLVYVAK